MLFDNDGFLYIFFGQVYECVYNKPSSQACTPNQAPTNTVWTYNPVSGEWMWAAGNSTTQVPATWGPKGQFSSYAEPGARALQGVVYDGEYFWVFGGQGLANPGDSQSYLSDLWAFDPSTRLWSWQGGCTVVDSAGVYGTRGEGSNETYPAGRAGLVMVADSKKRLWVSFGVANFQNQLLFLADLWRYDRDTSFWVWVGGPPGGVIPLPSYGTRLVEAETNQPGARSVPLQGVPNSINTPGGRAAPSMVVDSDGSNMKHRCCTRTMPFFDVSFHCLLGWVLDEGSPSLDRLENSMTFGSGRKVPDGRGTVAAPSGIT